MGYSIHPCVVKSPVSWVSLSFVQRTIVILKLNVYDISRLQTNGRLLVVPELGQILYFGRKH